MSYLNLDWKPVPIIPKFVDIVVNGIAERTYDINVYAQDSYGVEKRTQYLEDLIMDMEQKDINEYVQKNFGLNVFNTDQNDLPQNSEEFRPFYQRKGFFLSLVHIFHRHQLFLSLTRTLSPKQLRKILLTHNQVLGRVQKSRQVLFQFV